MYSRCPTKGGPHDRNGETQNHNYQHRGGDDRAQYQRGEQESNGRRSYQQRRQNGFDTPEPARRRVEGSLVGAAA